MKRLGSVQPARYLLHRIITESVLLIVERWSSTQNQGHTLSYGYGEGSYEDAKAHTRRRRMRGTRRCTTRPEWTAATATRHRLRARLARGTKRHSRRCVIHVPVAVGIRDGVVQLVSILGGAVSSAGASLHPCVGAEPVGCVGFDR
jgi:hypothetical protein